MGCGLPSNRALFVQVLPCAAAAKACAARLAQPSLRVSRPNREEPGEQQHTHTHRDMQLGSEDTGGSRHGIPTCFIPDEVEGVLGSKTKTNEVQGINTGTEGQRRASGIQWSEGSWAASMEGLCGLEEVEADSKVYYTNYNSAVQRMRLRWPPDLMVFDEVLHFNLISSLFICRKSQLL
ncbi:hypothetical protein EK904_007181 [Melospiza melodia maxima]|nr:hypothetical protein EK904_007181 [Melospiza melodia maxima]